MWMDYELDQVRKRNKAKLDAHKRKEQLELDAHIQGVRLAAKDAMDDMIEQDRAVVSKLAQQAIKASQRNKQRLKNQVKRQLKK